MDEDFGHKLHRLLGAIFIETLPLEKKKDILKSEFRIQISEQGKGLEGMCNLSDGIYERGIEQGIEQGIERGVEQGRVEAIIKLLKKGMSEMQIADLLEATAEQISKAKAMM